eukprot:4475622-Prymnesium_polylepis.1
MASASNVSLTTEASDKVHSQEVFPQKPRVWDEPTMNCVFRVLHCGHVCVTRNAYRVTRRYLTRTAPQPQYALRIHNT